MEACRLIADNFTIKWLHHRYFLPAFYALPMLPPHVPPYLFYKFFLKIQVHLFFGCFVICIYCIDSVTSVTFYGLSPSKKYCVIFFIESPLKLMGNAFYFILKALFILKIFQFLSRLFGHVGKMAEKVKVNFKIHGVTTWFINNCDTHIA